MSHVPQGIEISRRMTRQRLLLEGPFSREWYFGERVARQSLRSAEFIIPQAPPIGIRYTDSLDRAQIQRFRRGFWATDFLGEGDYGAFVATFLMRPLFGPMLAPAPRMPDEAGLVMAKSYHQFRAMQNLIIVV